MYHILVQTQSSSRPTNLENDNSESSTDAMGMSWENGGDYKVRSVLDLNSKVRNNHVWKNIVRVYYKDEPIDEKYYCLHCVKEHGFMKLHTKQVASYSKTLTTGTVKRHLIREHRNLGQPNDQKEVRITFQDNAKSKVELNAEFNRDLANLIQATDLPESIVDNDVFIRFFAKYLPDYTVQKPSNKSVELIRPVCKGIRMVDNQINHFIETIFSKNNSNCLLIPFIFTFQSYSLLRHLKRHSAILPHIKYLFAPFCLQSHWYLSVINVDMNVVYLFDSLDHLASSYKEIFEKSIDLVNARHLLIGQEFVDATNFHLIIIMHSFKQKNDWESGLYVCHFVKAFLERNPEILLSDPTTQSAIDEVNLVFKNVKSRATNSKLSVLEANRKTPKCQLSNENYKPKRVDIAEIFRPKT